MSEFSIVWRVASEASPARLTVNSESTALTYWSPRLEVEASLAHREAGKIYTEGCGQSLSFVVLFGACHWKGSTDRWLTEGDLAVILRSHREASNPRLLDLDGNFCVISYDHRSDSVWIGTDFWATAGVYYSASKDLIVVSSRAATVAHYCESEIDGISYIALIRNAVLPTGRTLFQKVYRTTMGQVLHFRLRERKALLQRLASLYQCPLSGSFKDSVEGTIGILQHIIPFSASASETLVDLTAGNDTRLTAATLANMPGIAKRLRFRFVEHDESPDGIVAREIADELGWNLIVRRNSNAEIPEDTALVGVAEAADGSFPMLSIAARLTAERKYWNDAHHLVGSTAGELFRNWNWQQELFAMGRTARVNYRALLKHRIVRDSDIDVERISDGRLTVEQHDELLIEPYRDLDRKYPEALNTHKLDLIYIQRLLARIPWWPLSREITLVLPFLWSEVTDISLRLPWWHKRTRRLVTCVVEKLCPKLAALPTDRRAPFRPLRLSTALPYAAYLATYTTDIIRRHYMQRMPAPLVVSKTRETTQGGKILPPSWADFLDPNGSICLHDSNGLIACIQDARSWELTESRRQEFLTMLMVELLCRARPGIRRSLVFDERRTYVGADSLDMFADGPRS